MQCNNIVSVINGYSALSIAKPENGHYRGRNMWLLALAISAKNISIVVF